MFNKYLILSLQSHLLLTLELLELLQHCSHYMSVCTVDIIDSLSQQEDIHFHTNYFRKMYSKKSDYFRKNMSACTQKQIFLLLDNRCVETTALV